MKHLRCPLCAGSLPQEARFCPFCGQDLESPAEPPEGRELPEGEPGRVVIQSHLGWSILSTVCCCIPVGIPAIFYSARVGSRARDNDLEGALRAARRAKVWAIAALVTGLTLRLLYFGLVSLVAIQG